MLTPDPTCAFISGAWWNVIEYVFSINAGATDKYEEVLKEVPKVRADLGYPPL